MLSHRCNLWSRWPSSVGRMQGLRDSTVIEASHAYAGTTTSSTCPTRRTVWCMAANANVSRRLLGRLQDSNPKGRRFRPSPQASSELIRDKISTHMGRTSKIMWTPKLQTEVTERITSGEPVHSIFADDKLPSRVSFYRELARNADFETAIDAREKGRGFGPIRRIY